MAEKNVKRRTSNDKRKPAKVSRKSATVERESKKQIAGTKREARGTRQEAAVAGDLRSYELTAVVSPTVKAEERQTVVAGLKKQISGFGGSVTAVDELGLRDLAYPIAHQLSGWYACLSVSLPAEAAQKLEEEMKRNEKVLRHLLVRK